MKQNRNNNKMSNVKNKKKKNKNKYKKCKNCLMIENGQYQMKQIKHLKKKDL